MPLYLCRWPNGDVSVVIAKNKTDAIGELDEFDNADYAEISRLNEFLIDLRLDDAGRLELAGLGESTEDTIMQTAFPELEAALTSDELLALKPESPQYWRKVRDAVARREDRPPIPRNERALHPSAERRRLIAKDEAPPR